jgi:hypothetical protein
MQLGMRHLQQARVWPMRPVVSFSTGVMRSKPLEVSTVPAMEPNMLIMACQLRSVAKDAL